MPEAIIQRLDRLYAERRQEIEEWLGAERQVKPPFFYTSVDLRHSGAKLAPVDTNLFPAGFNNLSLAAKGRAIRMMQDKLDGMQLPPQRILIVPENHTRNLFYLENLLVLAELLSETGREVRIGSLTSAEPQTLTTQSGREIVQWPPSREGAALNAQEFMPDLILLNNDCTSGPPSLLQGIAQPIEPPFQMGWYARRKSEHFRAYDEITQRFGEAFGFDHWLISAYFHRCGIIDFSAQRGVDKAAEGVERVLEKTRAKYREHGIEDQPYVFVKADSGTYGMGIMTVKSGEELRELNKKTRNKMNVIKEGAHNTEVIIQEGIPTIDRAEGAIAEPMIYVVDGVPVGGAYRINDERDAIFNLNAPGMRFTGMCDQGECAEGSKNRVKVPDCNFAVFGLVAALASLAAPREVYDGWEIGFSI